ncbi:hypothetical protein VNO77_35938 [Canavalia gladiata]|uniref:Uncharacterized protein n=1 Tax=Canavalia gladiata TaxID=3824 RepID=A0AAN9K8K5_CANGL
MLSSQCIRNVRESNEGFSKLPHRKPLPNSTVSAPSQNLLLQSAAEVKDAKRVLRLHWFLLSFCSKGRFGI